MKIILIYLILLLFATFSCGKQDKLLVKNLIGDDINILETNKEKILIISNVISCHDCMINLNRFIVDNYNPSKYDYFLLFEDPNNIPSRRTSKELYLNNYTSEIQKIYFLVEDSIVQKRLNIPIQMFKQAKPYLVYLDINKKAIYFSYEKIFNPDGTVKKTFKIK